MVGGIAGHPHGSALPTHRQSGVDGGGVVDVLVVEQDDNTTTIKAAMM